MASQQRLVALLEQYRSRLHGLGNEEHDEELEYVHQILSSPLFCLYKVGAASHEDTSKITEASKDVLSGMDASNDSLLSPGEKKKRQLQRKQSLKALRNVLTPSNSPMVQTKGGSGQKQSILQAPSPSDVQPNGPPDGIILSSTAQNTDPLSTSGLVEVQTSNKLHSSEGAPANSVHCPPAPPVQSVHCPPAPPVQSVHCPPAPPVQSVHCPPVPPVQSVHCSSAPPVQSVYCPPAPKDDSQLLQVTPNPPPQSSYSQFPPSSYSHFVQTPNKKVGSFTELSSIIDPHTSSPIPPSSPHSVAAPATETMTTRNTPTAESRRLVFTVNLEKGEEGLGFKVKGMRLEQKGELSGIFIQDLQPGGIAERNGLLKRNDQIVTINGHPLEGIPHAEAVKLLQAARGQVELVVSREQPAALPPGNYEFLHPQVHFQSGENSKTSQPQKIETIQLPNEGHGFGFGVIQSKDGTTIHSILPGGVADRDGRLRQNDILLQINDTVVRHVSYEAVVRMLREVSQGGKTVRLVVGHILQEQEEAKALAMPDVQSSDEEMEQFEVELHKPLGITIAGLVHPDTGEELDGIYITRLNPNGAAAQHGGILEGDKILVVDGQSLSGLENMEAAAILRNSANVVKLVLTRKRKPLSREPQLCSDPTSAADKNSLLPPPVEVVVTCSVGSNEMAPLSGHGDEVIPPPLGSEDVIPPPLGSDEVITPPSASGRAIDVPNDSEDGGKLLPPSAGNQTLTTNNEQLVSQAADSGESPPAPLNPSLPLDLPHSSSVTTTQLSSSLLAENGQTIGTSAAESQKQFENAKNDDQLLQKWNKMLGPNKLVKIVHLSRESKSHDLGILVEDIVQLNGNNTESVHHVIRHISKEGLIGQKGILQVGDEILEVNGILMRGLIHSNMTEILENIVNNAVIVACHLNEDDLSAIGSEVTVKDIVTDLDHSGSGDFGGTGDEVGFGETLDDQESPIDSSSESLPQLLDFVTQDTDFSRRFERKSWRERHELERRRLKEQFEKRREEYERHIREQEEELLQQEEELRKHQLQQAQEEEQHKFAESKPSSLLQDNTFDYSDHSPYMMMHQSPDSGGTESSTSVISPVPGSGLWDSEVTTIDLEKGQHGLGFSLLDFADPYHPGNKVILVHSLVPEGVAETDGRLQVGDRLVSVNGISVLGQTLQFAVQQLTGIKLGVVKIGVNHSLPMCSSPDVDSSPISLDSRHPFFAPEGQSIIDIHSQDEAEEVDQGGSKAALKHPISQKLAPNEEGISQTKVVSLEDSEVEEEEDPVPKPRIEPQEQKMKTTTCVGGIIKLQSDLQQFFDEENLFTGTQVVTSGSKSELTESPPSTSSVLQSISQDFSQSQETAVNVSLDRQYSSLQARLSPSASDLSADNEPELREVVIPKDSSINLGITLSYDDKNRCVIVKSVSNNSAIGKDGRIRIGDRIVSINRKSLEGANLTKAKSILKRAATKGEDVRITYLPCISVVVPTLVHTGNGGRAMVKASSAGTIGSPHLPQHYSFMGGMEGVPSSQQQVLPSLPLGPSSLPPQPLLPHPSPLSQFSAPWQQSQPPFYVRPSIMGSPSAFISPPTIGPPPPYSFPSRGPPPHQAPPTSYTGSMAHYIDVPMTLPAPTLPVAWGPGIIHRDPPKYSEPMISTRSGSQPSPQYPPMPRMSKSQSDSKFRSVQSKHQQVEKRHNSQGTNLGRTLPVYSALGDCQTSIPPSNQTQDQHNWPQWVQEPPPSAVDWPHGASGWPQKQIVGGATSQQDQKMGGDNSYAGSKPATWVSPLQDSPDHSHHNSLALDEEEDPALRKRYPDLEGHLYTVTLKKGKNGLGLSIVANNQTPRGIVIMGVQRGGVADSSGKIKWGDVILEVNDVSVIGKSQQKFQEMLGQAPVSVTLTLVRPPTTAAKHSGNVSLEGLAQVRTITLKREDERGFGFEFCEVPGINGDKSTLTISKIMVGTPADHCGQLQMGDQLISIDGQKVLGYSYDKARCLLQRARSHGNVCLIVASSGGGAPPPSGEVRGQKQSEPPARKTSTAVIRNRSRCNPLRQSRRRPVSVDNEKDTASSGLTSTFDHDNPTSVHSNRNPQNPPPVTNQEDMIVGEKNGVPTFRGSEPLGITVTGGAGTSLAGVYIQRIHSDSPAAKDERLRVGDRVLAIDNHSLDSMKKEEMTQAIQQAGPFVHLTIPRQSDGVIEAVELAKPDGGGLGLFISEMQDLPGVYVQEVVQNQSAYINGRIRVGDRILSINGQDTTAADQETVVKLLQACKGVVILTVQHLETADSLQQTVVSDKLYQDPLQGSRFHGQPSYPSTSIRVPAHSPPPYVSTSTAHLQYAANGTSHMAMDTRCNADQKTSLEQSDGGMKRHVVKLHRGPSGLGFTIIGGKGTPQGDLPIIINRVLDKGAAARDGRIKAGNQLLAVNGVNFSNLTHQQAALTLKYLQGDVELTVLSSD